LICCFEDSHFDLDVLCSTLLHLTPLRFLCVGGWLGMNPRLLRLLQGQSDTDDLTIRLDHIHNSAYISSRTRPNLIHTRLGLIHIRLDLIHNSARSHPRSASSHPHLAGSLPLSARSHPHSARSHPHSDRILISSIHS
jgi:hypothetical protein